jgi:hypothetical protein
MTTRSWLLSGILAAFALTGVGCGTDTTAPNPINTGGYGGYAGSGGYGGFAGTGGFGGSTTGNHIKTVFVIMMENHNWKDIKANLNAAPYINNTLLLNASHAENYHGVGHPSLPNYLAIEAGDTFSRYSTTSAMQPGQEPAPTEIAKYIGDAPHLVTTLEAHAIPWRSYQEGISGRSCPLADEGNYLVRHNPMVYFNDVTNAMSATSAHCMANVRPLDQLAGDLQSNAIGRYNFITPNRCNDMHDNCGIDPITAGDRWLGQWVPTIQGSTAYQDGGAIFIVWDESDSGLSCLFTSCPVGMIVLSPLAKGNFMGPTGYSNDMKYDHLSTLKTMQRIFNVTAWLGGVKDDTPDLSDLFNVFP